MVEPREPCEVTVEGNKFGVVLDRECRQVRVGSQIAGGSGAREKAAEDVGMAPTRLQNHSSGRRQPGLYLVHRPSRAEGVRKHHGAGAQPDECEEDNPCQANGLATGQRAFKPAERDPVLDAGSVRRVEQDVGVDDNHAG